MPNVIYRYTKVKDRTVCQSEISSLGAALSLARYDIEYDSQRYLPIDIQAEEGSTYEIADIMRLTGVSVDRRILVMLPLC